MLRCLNHLLGEESLSVHFHLGPGGVVLPGEFLENDKNIQLDQNLDKRCKTAELIVRKIERKSLQKLEIQE